MDDMSKAYGTALFALACEENAKADYSNALEIIDRAVKENPEYIELLASPGIKLAERLNAIEAAFGAALPEHVLSFVKLLCEKGHIHSLEACIGEYRKLLELSERILTAKVVSAVALTDDQQARLKEKLEQQSGNAVILDCTVDESLMGGLIIEIDGKVMDGSLRHRLKEVKEVMSR